MLPIMMSSHLSLRLALTRNKTMVKTPTVLRIRIGRNKRIRHVVKHINKSGNRLKIGSCDGRQQGMSVV